MDWIKAIEGGVEITVRATPRAASNGVQGVLGGALKIRLQAPPVEGKANEALARFLAERLGIPARRISVVAGAASRNKRVQIAGVDLSATIQALKV